MFYLFLDESGDLGFDFNKPGTTKYFVETVLLLPNTAAKRAMEKAAERTLKAKVSPGRKDRSVLELKGAETDFAVKRHFWRQCAQIDFEIYTVILDKDCKRWTCFRGEFFGNTKGTTRLGMTAFRERLSPS